MKKKEIIGHLLTAVTAILFALMLVQCVLYIRLAESFEEGSLPVFPESEIMLLAKGSEGTIENAGYLISPCFTGAVLGGTRYSAGYGSDEENEIWQCFVDVLTSAINGTSKKVTHSDADNKNNYLDELYNSSEDCFYIKLASEFELSALCSFLSDTDTGLPENPDFGISDMFLLCGSGGEAYITAVSTDGEVLKIFPSRNIAFNKELLETYNNTETEVFEFLKFENNLSHGKNGYFPVYKHSSAVRGVEKALFADVFGFSRDSVYIMDFVDAFGINTDNVRVYETAEGTMVFVENATCLSISDNGYIEYIPEQSTMEEMEFAGIWEDNRYSFFEMSGASKDIVFSLNEMLKGCAAKFTLTDISYSDGKCIFSYDYTAGIVPIRRESGHGLVLEFSERGLEYAYAHIEPYFYLDYKKTDMPQKTAFTLLKNSMESPVGYFGIQYHFDDEDKNTGTARWAAITYEEAAE